MSQFDAQTKTIDGEEFRVLMLDPLVANDLLVDILKTAGPALAALLAPVVKAPDSGAAFRDLLDGSSGGETPAFDGEGIERAIVGLVDRLEKPKLREVISTLEGVTSVRKGDGWPQLSTVAPMLFRGRLKLMYRWLAFALRVQYQDFF